MSNEDRKEPGDGRFESEAQRLLRRSAEDIDPRTQARLRQAREEALRAYDRRRGKRPAWESALSAAAVCATAVIAVALWMNGAPGPTMPGFGRSADTAVDAAPLPAADSATKVAEEENLEVIEDLEFYDWLESDLAPEAEVTDPGLSG